VQLPSVIRLLEYRRIPHQTRALSRKNILMRDRYTCQYCQKTLPSSEMTLDHVIPRSRAGETTWENLVACCHHCNNKKGCRTPEEAGMKLTRPPRPFRASKRTVSAVFGRTGFVAPEAVAVALPAGTFQRPKSTV
jgi:5-methylcytosine-specific restriction endonuclease McrA